MHYGLHVTKGKFNSIDEALHHTVWSCAQIFTHGPQSTRKVKLDVNSLSEYAMPLYVHSSYVTAIFGTAENPHPNQIYFPHLIEQARLAMQIGAKLVIHLQARSTKLITETLKLLESSGLRAGCAPILLEMIAMKPSDISYETPQKVQALFDEMSQAGLQHDYGWCLDTAHIWAAGVDLSSTAAVKKYVRAMKAVKYRGKRVLDLVHLNGSVQECGSGRDGHAMPGSKVDKIWGGSQPSLAYLEFKGIDMITEVPNTPENVSAACKILQNLK